MGRSSISTRADLLQVSQDASGVLEVGLQDFRAVESIVAEIAAASVGLAPEQVDEHIDRGLGRLCECLELDLATVLLWTDSDRLDLEVTHEWHRDSEGPVFKGQHVQQEFPSLFARLRSADSYVINDVDELDDDAAAERQACAEVGIKSVVWVAFGSAPEVSGFVVLNSLSQVRPWPDDVLNFMRLCGEVIANVLARKTADLELRRAFHEIQVLKSKLETENTGLRAELSRDADDLETIGNSEVMQRLARQIEQVAPTDSTVLLLGETGTGKSLAAGTLHRLSKRREQPLIAVDCATLPPPLIESELFGHERGAFTGAVGRKTGRFELADRGTLFLDEIGELPLDLQAKLLRVLQQGEFERVGSSRTQTVDVRVVAATNRNLEALVAEGVFRADLYYRLSVFPLTVPLLRDRLDDIPLLVWFLVQRLQGRVGKRFETIPQHDLDALKTYDWPGNVRELSNVVERAMIVSTPPQLDFGGILPAPKETLSTSIEGQLAPRQRLDDVEREHILRVLEQCSWRVRGQGGAAERLGLKRSTLQARMKKLGIERPAG